MVSRNQDKL
jgi:17beta-estradiol 17-dehydrogenase / very-long-chain 3-oxoacyl-CoA reductase